jgi:Tol biopolymer transport system component
LGDDAQNPRYIETIRKVGYRLVAPVRPVYGQADERRPSAGVPARGWAQRAGSDRRARLRAWGSLVVAVAVVAGVAWFVGQRQASLVDAPLAVVPLTAYEGLEFDPALSPDGAQLAFVWNGEDKAGGANWDLYVKQLGAASPLRLTEHAGLDGSPAWSPDGKRLAFLRATEDACGVYVLPVPAGDARRVAPCHVYSESAVAWLPDGRRLVFADRPDPSRPFRLFLVDVETLDVTAVTHPEPHLYGDLDPAVSPDGSTLAFVRGAVEGTIAKSLSPVLGDLYLQPLTGGRARPLTRDQHEIPGFSWAPDGKSIVFASNRAGGRFGLWRVTVPGGDLTWLLGGDALFRNPAMAGTGLAYERWEGDSNIMRRMLHASEPTVAEEKVVPSTRWEGDPDVSPEGTRLAFASSRSGTPEIWVHDSESSDLVCVTGFGGPHTGTPRWSPDGEQIAFVSFEGGQADVFVTGAGGGAPRRLTAHAAHDLRPTWSHDGAWVYFGSNRSGAWQVWRVPSEGGVAEQMTTHGGFTAQEGFGVDPALYYARLDTFGIWRQVPGGAPPVLVTGRLHPKDWGNWIARPEGIYFVSREEAGRVTVERVDPETRQVVQIADGLRGMPLGQSSLALSPDGAHLLYVRREHVAGDIMFVPGYP